MPSDIIAETGLQLGLDAKKSEVHGMAQRGGAVVSHVRWAEKVNSPLCEKGTVDYLIAQEMLEGVRWLEYLRSGGTIIISQQHLPPTSTIFGNATYPSDEQIVNAIREVAGQVIMVDAIGTAERLGNRRTANSVLIGVLSSVMEVPLEAWLETLVARVPARHQEVNRQAFFAGREDGISRQAA